jgi:hypothetical protein
MQWLSQKQNVVEGPPPKQQDWGELFEETKHNMGEPNAGRTIRLCNMYILFWTL